MCQMLMNISLKLFLTALFMKVCTPIQVLALSVDLTTNAEDVENTLDQVGASSFR